MGTSALPWPLFIVRRKRSPETPLLTSAVVRLFFFAIYLFFTIVDLLMFLRMESKNLLKDMRSHSWRNSFAYNNAILLQFCSLVGVSITNPEVRFINMVLSSAISNGLTNSFFKTVTTFDLRDSDFRICEGRVRLYTSYCSLITHICSKEFKFWDCSALPMVQLVNASLSGENLLILPTVLASLFSDCSPRCSTAVWRLYLACDWIEKMISSLLCSESVSYVSDVYTSCRVWHSCAYWWKRKRVRRTLTHTFSHQICPFVLQY